MRRFWIILIISLTFCANVLAKEKLDNNFHGISGSLLINLQNIFKAKQQALQKLDTEKIVAFYNEAPNEITKILEPFGYFNVKVQPKIFRRGNVWYADYYITLNRPVKITAIDLKIFGSGAQNSLLQKLPQNVPIKVGNILEIEKYEDTKKMLFNTAENLGYLNAALLKKEIRINLINYSAEITLYFDTGVRYYFGKAIFSKTSFSKKFLEKFLNFQENEPYSSAKVEELRDTLSNSSFFQEVFITPNISLNKSRIVPLNINLTPRKSRQYSFGLGYGTDTGIRGLFGVEFRH
jgi:translocation and assembly module TamA